MPRSKKKKKNPLSCPRGKKLVKIGAREFCAKTGGKKKAAGARSRKSDKKGSTKTSLAERKKTMRATCKRVSATTRKTMAGLCNWAAK